MLAVLGILFLIGYYAWSMIFGITRPETMTPLTFSHARPQKKAEVKNIEVAAVSAVAFDRDSGARIFDQNGDARRPIASLTKMMSALVFLDHNPGWDTIVTIQKSDLQSGGRANFFTGDRVTVRDLFKAALIASDNSGITALARSSALTETEFAAAMNKKASELRMGSAYFVEPTGLDLGNQATAVDVSKLAAAAFAKPEMYQALQLSRFEFPVSASVRREVVATDQLLGKTLPRGARIIAGKTGYLPEAGFCFAGEFLSGDKKIITVILGAPTEAERFSQTEKILDWTLGAYLWDNTK